MPAIRLRGSQCTLGFLRRDGRLFRRPLDCIEAHPERLDPAWESIDFSRQLEAVYLLLTDGEPAFEALVGSDPADKPAIQTYDKLSTIAEQALITAGTGFFNDALPPGSESYLQYFNPARGTTEAFLAAGNALCIIHEKTIEAWITQDQGRDVEIKDNYVIKPGRSMQLLNDLRLLVRTADVRGIRYVINRRHQEAYRHASVTTPFVRFSAKGKSARETLGALATLESYATSIGLDAKQLATIRRFRKRS